MSHSENSDGLVVRQAEASDTKLVHEFILAIADYEKMSDQVEATEESIRDALFGEKPKAECLLAFWDGKPAAYAVYFYNFSTFTGRAGLYLEDLFVKPEFRRKGIGKKMLIRLARIAKDRNCPRFEWVALDWNQNAWEFYKSLGAVTLDGWTTFRAGAEAIDKLAACED